jgi:hypothetical protein
MRTSHAVVSMTSRARTAAHPVPTIWGVCVCVCVCVCACVCVCVCVCVCACVRERQGSMHETFRHSTSQSQCTLDGKAHGGPTQNCRVQTCKPSVCMTSKCTTSARASTCVTMVTSTSAKRCTHHHAGLVLALWAVEQCVSLRVRRVLHPAVMPSYTSGVLLEPTRVSCHSPWVLLRVFTSMCACARITIARVFAACTMTAGVWHVGRADG